MSTRRGARVWFRVFASVLILTLCISQLAIAQTTGNIEGSATDQSGAPLPGVSVEVTSPKLQGTRNTVTSADGRFRFPSLPPGAYRVTAVLPGFGRVQKNATVTLDATATVALELSLVTTAEVTVTGEAPLVDSTSTTQGTNYTAKVIDKLPVGRNYADIVFTQPGVQADFGETQGRSLAISIYGSTSSENLFLIDGVNTTNVIKGFQGKDINTEFIEEVEVKTGGYQAEYGRNTGGVVNVITKSGGNEFHGGVFGYFNDTGMRANVVLEADTPPYSEQGGALSGGFFPTSFLSKDVRQEYGFDLGGFILKDKVWFFGAYDRVQVNRLTKPVSGVRAGENFPIGQFQNKYAGKITLNLFQGTSVVGSVFSDRQVQSGAIAVPAGTNPYSYNGRIDTGGPDYAARVNQLLGSSGIFTFQYSHHADRNNTTPSGPDVVAVFDDTPSIFPDPQNPTQFGASQQLGGYGLVFGPVNNNASRRNAYSGSYTAYVGNHEIKVGGDYQQDDTFGTTYYTGAQFLDIFPCTQTGTSVCDLSRAPFHTNANGDTTQVFYEHDFLTPSGTDQTLLAQAPFDTPTNRWSAYVQDQWRVVPTLSINAGLRYDSEDLKRGDGETAFTLTGQWAPRVGVVWDFIGDGTSKLYASAGRFYYSMPTDLNVRVFTANSGFSTFNYDPTDLTQDPNAPRKQLAQVGSIIGEPVDRGLKASYQDELTLGVEKALDPTSSLGLKATYRTLRRTIEDRCDLDYVTSPLNSSCALANPGGSGPAASGQYPVCNGSGNPTDPTKGDCGLPGVPMADAKRTFRGIELIARKQFSNTLWAQVSFLYSSLRGNYSGAIRETSGQTDPGINADFDYPQFAVNAYGNLDLDRPYQGRLDAAYTASFGLSAGLQFYARSGLPLSRLGFFNNFYPDLLYLDQRGTDGRSPTDYEMNLSLAYNVRVGPVTITPQLYVYNLLNRQTPITYFSFFNRNGSFVTDPSSPFYSQAGVQPGTAGPDGTICQSATPCPDDPNYRKVTSRTDPRLLRVAIKITF